MSTKYIKSKDGKFAGSIGDAKTKVPVAPAKAPDVVRRQSDPTTVPAGLSAAIERFTSRELNPYKLPEWATSPEFRWFNPAKATEWDDGFALRVDTDHDDLPHPGSPYSSAACKDYIDGVLELRKHRDIKNAGTGSREEIWLAPTLADPDGENRRYGVRYEYTDSKASASYAFGYLSTDGTFTDTDIIDSPFELAMKYDSPLREYAGGDIDEVEVSIALASDGTPAGLEFKAETEWYDAPDYDPNDEYEPDRYLD